MVDGDSWLRSFLADVGLYYGWFVVVGCFLLSTMTAGVIYSFSVFLGPILEAYGRSHGNTSLVFSLQSLVTFGGAAVLGFAVDRYGLRRLLVLAAALLGGGLVAASRAPTFEVVVVSYSIVAAAGLGITFVVAYTTPPRWFDRRRGLATGIAVSGWGVGIVAGPPTSEWLIRQFGWQGAYLWLGGASLAAIAVSLVLLADRPNAIGIDSTVEFDEPPAAARTERTLREQFAEAAAIVRTTTFALVFVGLLLAFVPSYAVLIYLVEFTESVGIDRRIGVFAVSTAGVANIVAKFTVGVIADRAGMDLTLAGCVAVMSAAAYGLVIVPTPLSLLVLAAIFGLGYGGIATLMSPLVAGLFGTADLSTLFGITSIGFGIAGLTVPYLVGVGVDTFGTYEWPFLAATTVGVASIGIFLLIRSRRER